MTRIVEHLSIEALERRYRAAQDVTEARHTQAVWLLAQGRTVLDVAGVAGITSVKVVEIVEPKAVTDQVAWGGIWADGSAVASPSMVGGMSSAMPSTCM